MYRDLEGLRVGAKPFPPHILVLGEAEGSAHGREVPGAAVLDRSGLHARQSSIANCFQYYGRFGGTSSVDRGIHATRGSPRIGLGVGGKEHGIICE